MCDSLPCIKFMSALATVLTCSLMLLFYNKAQKSEVLQDEKRDEGRASNWLKTKEALNKENRTFTQDI